MGTRVWLNVDLGELPGEPEALYACANVANVACGGHAGDDASMQRAIDFCARYGVLLGAHPSYPDREGFGRRRIEMTPDTVRSAVTGQCSRLGALARDLPVLFVKPHGALYHAAREDPATAEAVVLGARDALGADVTIVGPPSGALLQAAGRARMAFAREGFADRAARDDGTLVAREEPGAMVVDPAAAAARARALAARGDVDTICVHGDTPCAVAVARAVRAVLDEVARGPRA
jgi:UPF0271 protein